MVARSAVEDEGTGRSRDEQWNGVLDPETIPCDAVIADTCHIHLLKNM